MKQAWTHLSFFWLLVVSLLGFLLRSAPVFDLDFNYKFVLHAHSHLAFFGWIFSALFTLITLRFLPASMLNSIRYSRLFWLIQVANVGMLLGFLYQGYGLFSILFSCMHIILAVKFAVQLYNDVIKNDLKETSSRFLLASLIFMVLSFVGVLFVPVATVKFGAGSPAYHNAIYFFLHFQYNGWFIFALLALFFKELEKNGVSFSVFRANLFLTLMTISCVLSYSLSLLWNNPGIEFFIVGGFASMLQLIGAFVLIRLVYSSAQKLQEMFSFNIRSLFLIGLSAFVMKVVLQFISAFPAIAKLAATERNLVISYLHLVVIGIVSISIFAFTAHFIRIENPVLKTKAGFITFLSGFVLSELIIVYKGLVTYFDLPHIIKINELLLAVTALMPAGLLLISFNYILTRLKIKQSNTSLIFNNQH